MEESTGCLEGNTKEGGNRMAQPDVRRQQAEEAFYARYFPLARAAAARFLADTGSEEDIEECANDALLEVMAHPDKYDENRAGLTTYIHVVARSRALNRRRELTRRATLPLEEDLLVETDAPGASDPELRAAVRRAVLSLSEADRRLFTLKYVYEYRNVEIAGALHLSESAAHTRVCRLRTRLIRLLARQGVTGWEA